MVIDIRLPRLSKVLSETSSADPSRSGTSRAAAELKTIDVRESVLENEYSCNVFLYASSVNSNSDPTGRNTFAIGVGGIDFAWKSITAADPKDSIVAYGVYAGPSSWGMIPSPGSYTLMSAWFGAGRPRGSSICKCTRFINTESHSGMSSDATRPVSVTRPPNGMHFRPRS